MSKQTSGTVTSLALLAVSLGAIGFAGYNMLPGVSMPSASTAKSRTLVVPNACALFGALGLDAHSLAAAGVSGENVGVMLEDLQAYLDENGAAFIGAVDAHHVAAKQSDSDERLIRAGKPPENEVLTAHAATLSSAASSRNSYQTAALDAALTHLTEDQRTRLATIRGNTSREVPAAYCLVTRTDAEWIALRTALAAERQATARSESPAGAVSSLLATVRAEGATATALSNTASLLAGVRTALQSP